MSIIRLENVSKRYSSNQPALSNINLNIEKGEFAVIVGPSGCGKTTLLKLINGVVQSTEGKIFIDGREHHQWDMIQLRRNIGYVIQQIALFPHMTIEKNISYVPELKKESPIDIANRAKELISLVGLSEDYLNRYPRQLSGGQMQRVGIGRALAADPEIILMDEPLGAVDEVTRVQLQDELLELHRKLKKTIVFVTHDLDEAFKLGTKIILLNQGKLEQVGTKEEILLKPESDFVSSFLKSKHFLLMMNHITIQKWIDKKTISDDLPPVTADSSLFQVMELMMKGNHSVAAVKSGDKIIGSISLEKIQREINKMDLK